MKELHDLKVHDLSLYDEFMRLSVSQDPSLKGLVVAGHFDSFRRNSERGTILKLTNIQELRVRSALEKANSGVFQFLPRVDRTAEMTCGTKCVLEMEDLTHQMRLPCLIDVKMGTRTYTEEDDASGELRPDLLGKMLKQRPDAATEEERRAGGISKLRYLRFRDEETTTAELGFRVDGISLSGGSAAPSADDLKSVGTEGQLERVLQSFLTGGQDLARTFVELLVHLRKAFEACSCCASLSFIRTSLLLVYDHEAGLKSARVRLIDFSHVYEARERLTHRASWRPGNDEDGFLIGLDNIIAMLERQSRTPQSDRK